MQIHKSRSAKIWRSTDQDPQKYADPQIKIRKNMQIHGSRSAKICRSTDQYPQKYADPRIKIRKKIQIHGSRSAKICRSSDQDPSGLFLNFQTSKKKLVGIRIWIRIKVKYILSTAGSFVSNYLSIFNPA